MLNRTLTVIGLAALAGACGSNPPVPQPPTPPTPPTSTTPETKNATAPTATATATATASAEPPAKPAPVPAVRFTGLSTPESVLYDEARDRYLVSNINGKPGDADNNGFISVLTPDGKIDNLKWIEGGKNKVTLNAPKGMALVKDVLYVADIDVVRTFDVKTGAPKAEIKLDGATFANDVAAGADGKVYVSDSGIKIEAEIKPTGTDAVYVIENGKAKAFAKSTDLNKPNGVLVDGKNVLVVTFGANELFKLDDKGKKGDVTKLPKGQLDGLLKVGDDYLVSSWEGQAIYKGKMGGTFEPVLEQLKAPADIGWDKKRNRVLVPRFMENAVEAYEVK